ncbi:retrotransposon protein, putative, unclassified [Panicum miliaceum]|uniref:Retrotransposon protein, putative, unclassified n=1 Tax=Panicum miliaceum TaxID=4540 RepID=A0A3L6PSJ5_PANMI|nr:retrotransposon protein, putative, unclassified [Panicum miliaceum]
MKDRYIPNKLPTSLPGWRDRWFYVGNHALSLAERTPGAPILGEEWTTIPEDKSQVNELLEKIMELRNKGVTGTSMIYSWSIRRIQPLQKLILQGEAVMRASRVLLDANMVPYLQTLFHVRNPRKQVRVSSRTRLSSTYPPPRLEL